MRFVDACIRALPNRKHTLSLHEYCVGHRKVDLKREIAQNCKFVGLSWPDQSSSLNLSIVCICKLLLRNTKLQKFLNRKQATMQDRPLSFFNFYVSLHSTINGSASMLPSCAPVPCSAALCLYHCAGGNIIKMLSNIECGPCQNGRT
jgi:hypothetical protein